MMKLRVREINGMWRVQRLVDKKWIDVTKTCKAEKTAEQRMAVYRCQKNREELMRIACQVMAKKWGDIIIPRE